MIEKLKKIFNTDVKLIMTLLIALLIDIMFIIYAYKNSYTAIVISVILLVILLFLIIKLTIVFQLKNIKYNFLYTDVQIVMPLLLEHLNNTNDKYLYVSKKLYNVLPLINGYFYFESSEKQKHKIKVLIDDSLKHLEYKTNSTSPYISNITDIY